MFNRMAKPIRIIGHPDNQRPDKWSSAVLEIMCFACRRDIATYGSNMLTLLM